MLRKGLLPLASVRWGTQSNVHTTFFTSVNIFSLWGLLGTSFSRIMLEACKNITIFKPYESTSHIWMSEWKFSVIKCPNPSAKPPKIISRFASHNRSRKAKTAGMVFGVEKSRFLLYVTAFGTFFLKVEGISMMPFFPDSFWNATNMSSTSGKLFWLTHRTTKQGTCPATKNGLQCHSLHTLSLVR